MPEKPEITAPWPNFDGAEDIVIGCGVVAIVSGVLLKNPAVRDYCGRVLARPRVREALSAVAESGWDRVFESLRRGGTPSA